MKKSRASLLIAAAAAAVCALALLPSALSDRQPSSADELPIRSQTESDLTVHNICAVDVTKSSATLKVKISRASVYTYTLLLGDSPDRLVEAGSGLIGGARSEISHPVTGLSEHTRYYFAFRILTFSEHMQTETRSFVTPDDYYDGSAGGICDETVSYGLDLSAQSESVDFARFAEQNLSFVILRAGSSRGKDVRFEDYYEQAKAAGLKIGVYYDSFAGNLAQIEQDADDCLAYVCGKIFDFPVYLRMEPEGPEDPSRSLLTEMAFTFCETIADAGYYPGIYGTPGQFESQLNTDALAAVYELWLNPQAADNGADSDYSERYGIWQNSDAGGIDGVPGEWKLNVCCKDYSAIIRRESAVYRFEDSDGSLLWLAEVCPGSRIYPPDLTPVRPCDDEYEYTFAGWTGLDENTIATPEGGVFRAFYSKNSHEYDDFEEISTNERVRVCERCGHTLSEPTEVVLIDWGVGGEGVRWYLYSDGNLLIAGIGALQTSEYAIYADRIGTVEIGAGIRAIGENCFRDFGRLSRVIFLGKEPVLIGDAAFLGCAALHQINLPWGSDFADNAFDGTPLVWNFEE